MTDAHPEPELPEIPDLNVHDDESIAAATAQISELLLKYDLDLKIKLKHKKPKASNCEIEGLGVDDAEVDIPANFKIQSRDNNGQPLNHGGEPFVAMITDPDGELVPCKLTDNGDGTYDVDFTPVKAGKHDVKVKLNDEDIGGSPTTLDVAPATPDASKCTADGPGLVESSVGNPAPFKITAYNKAGKPLKVGGHNFESKLEGPHGEVPVAVKDNGDGTYDAEYIPVHEGDSTVDVKVGDHHIKDSPFKVEVVKAEGKPDATQTFADGPGVENEKCDTWSPAIFTVHSIDPKGVPVTTGGDPFDVTVTDSNGDEIPSTLKDNEDGTYTGEYKPEKPDVYTVDVILRRPLEPLFFEHIKDCPVKVKVLAGLDPSKCIAHGPGLENGQVQDTMPAEFKIEARDFDEKPIKTGGQPFDVKVKDPEGNDVPAKIKDNGDGTHDVVYEPEVDGPHTITIDCDGKPVASSPYTVDVERGASHDHTSIGRFSFVIAARGKNGKPMDSRAMKDITIEVTPADAATPPVKAEIMAKKDGKEASLKGQYWLPGPGEYSVTIKILGKDIHGCPYKHLM